ncbi:hypothetical protein GCM10018966_090720 [Streptomyces yanii]
MRGRYGARHRPVNGQSAGGNQSVIRGIGQGAFGPRRARIGGCGRERFDRWRAESDRAVLGAGGRERCPGHPVPLGRAWKELPPSPDLLCCGPGPVPVSTAAPLPLNPRFTPKGAPPALRGRAGRPWFRGVTWPDSAA